MFPVFTRVLGIVAHNLLIYNGTCVKINVRKTGYLNRHGWLSNFLLNTQGFIGSIRCPTREMT